VGAFGFYCLDGWIAMRKSLRRVSLSFEVVDLCLPSAEPEISGSGG
jgi:hypothetical protein